MNAVALEIDTGAPLLLRDDQDSVATLTLNRPEARNALSRDLMEALQTQLDAIAGDGTVKAVIIGGSGAAFCAGHDLKEIRSNDRREIFEALFTQCSNLMTSIVRLPKPVIARVHGIATAAGCQLVASCDLAVASTEAHFATPGVNLGLFCSTPMVAVSRAVGSKQTMEMLLTGTAIDAERARELGLINRVVPPEALNTDTRQLAANIASKSPLTVKIGKAAFYRQLEMDLDGAYAYTSEVMTENMMAADAREGIDAFMQKREPLWKGK
ncbi:MAG: Short-chain-enoyl-CoA hydratase [Alphaproteobacteria bacterium MarineAlpha9_Bin7]|nr:MAG: Short-chain-enoyl-CoA hydratase [Alphaproteobacteria bacterium MarineAlpha9_Bin7]